MLDLEERTFKNRSGSAEKKLVLYQFVGMGWITVHFQKKYLPSIRHLFPLDFAKIFLRHCPGFSFNRD